MKKVTIILVVAILMSFIISCGGSGENKEPVDPNIFGEFNISEMIVDVAQEIKNSDDIECFSTGFIKDYSFPDNSVDCWQKATLNEEKTIITMSLHLLHIKNNNHIRVLIDLPVNSKEININNKNLEIYDDVEKIGLNSEGNIKYKYDSKEKMLRIENAHIDFRN